jgi:hypothetical protein
MSLSKSKCWYSKNVHIFKVCCYIVMKQLIKMSICIVVNLIIVMIVTIKVNVTNVVNVIFKMIIVVSLLTVAAVTV